jgi:hypothetical protein
MHQPWPDTKTSEHFPRPAGPGSITLGRMRWPATGGPAGRGKRGRADSDEGRVAADSDKGSVTADSDASPTRASHPSARRAEESRTGDPARQSPTGPGRNTLPSARDETGPGPERVLSGRPGPARPMSRSESAGVGFGHGVGA